MIFDLDKQLVKGAFWLMARPTSSGENEPRSIQLGVELSVIGARRHFHINSCTTDGGVQPLVFFHTHTFSFHSTFLGRFDKSVRVHVYFFFAFYTYVSSKSI